MPIHPARTSDDLRQSSRISPVFCSLRLIARTHKMACRACLPALRDELVYHAIMHARVFLYKNMSSQLKASKEIEIATSKITTMFLNFGQI